MRATLPERAARSVRQIGGAPEVVGRLSAYAGIDALPWDGVELVVECVPEVLELKQRVFRDLDRHVEPGVVLASNSSSFPIRDIAAGVSHPERTLGLHYFLPAHLVPVVEVIRGPSTADAVMDDVTETMRALGKVPVRVERDVPGFLANRLQHALMREAFALIEEGVATPEDVDAAVRFGFGLRYLAAGPVMQKDLAGLDVHGNAARTIYPTLSNAPEPPPVLTEKAARGDIGIKAPSRRGFYQWDDEKIRVFRERYDALLGAALELLREELPPRRG